MTHGGDSDTDRTGQPGRWRLIRDLLVFQIKLFADGVRDVIFSPVSIVMGLLDLITGGRRFYDLLTLGARTDVWINLFGKYDHDGGLDDTVTRIEEKIAEQYEKGGITASAKQAVDSTLDRLSRDKRSGPDQES